MKDWMIAHKMHLGVAGLIALAGIYYVYFYTPVTISTPKIDGVENQLSSDAGKKEKDTKQPSEKFIVDVKGQVKHPGVYESSQGERVVDVITRAGGPTETADENKVNFAEHVQDEMVIYIPAKGEESSTVEAGTSNASATPGSASSKQEKININKADVSQLQSLPGIGPAKAAAIISYRDKSGPFKTVEDLKNITGIGEKTFEKLKDLIAVH